MCRVVSGSDPSTLVYRDSTIAAFPPLRSETTVHLLVVPIEHFESLPELLDAEPQLVGTTTQVAGELAAERGLVESGYRLVWNHGRDTRQRIGHPHLHLIGGQPLAMRIG
jgi:histidine triad (HIT) family protein